MNRGMNLRKLTFLLAKNGRPLYEVNNQMLLLRCKSHTLQTVEKDQHATLFSTNLPEGFPRYCFTLKK